MVLIDEPLIKHPENNPLFPPRRSSNEKRPGKRNDIELVRNLVLAGTDLVQLYAVAPSYQAYKFGEIGVTLHSKKRNFKPLVRWFFGAPGTGKSFTAHHLLGEDVYVQALATFDWWPGYHGQENVLLDEFRAKKCPLSTLLSLLDRYSCQVAYKGGNCNFMGRHIIITSPFAPHDVYGDVKEDMWQLYRRIDEIWLFEGLPGTPPTRMRYVHGFNLPEVVPGSYDPLPLPPAPSD